MTFTVKYRAIDGKMCEKCIEAASRSECVAKCKAQGVAPISVKEGGKVSNAKTQRREERKALGGKVIWIIAGIVALGGVLWCFLGRQNEVTVKGEKPKAVTPVKTKIKEKTPVKAQTANPAPKPPKAEKPEYVKKPGQLQLPDGKILTFPTPKPGETRKVHAYGHTYECDHLGNFRDITPRKLFHTAFEANFLGLAVEGGAFIPAFLTGLDESDVKKMLLKKYEPIGDETEEEMAKLKAYDEMRCTALEFMEQGGKFDDFVNELASFEKKQRQTRAMGLGEVMKLVKQGKLAEAKEMAEAANKLMEQKGYKPIMLPAHVQNAFDNISENSTSNQEKQQ
ncbi:MAG: hypothetical protein E7046_13135 [Lentisphaerae bacterium]|nr:hypothetical protein [Lentisphaerota bacterium]